MCEHYLIEFVHHRVMIILARLDTWPILVIYTRNPFYFGILYYVLSISEFPLFLLAPLFVRYLSLGHPRLSKVWSDENSTKMFSLYLKTYAKNTKIQIKKKPVFTGDFLWAYQNCLFINRYLKLNRYGQLFRCITFQIYVSIYINLKYYYLFNNNINDCLM